MSLFMAEIGVREKYHAVGANLEYAAATVDSVVWVTKARRRLDAHFGIIGIGSHETRH